MQLFFQQYPIVIPFIAIISAEALKAVIDFIRKRGRVRFINPGGMPSGHSSFVSALVVVVAYREGTDSSMFMVSAVIALIVMYDAITLRHEAGLHAKAINKLKPSFELEESLGHTLAEVTVGAIFGSLVAFFLLNI
jgi:uncharacterized protein